MPQTITRIMGTVQCTAIERRTVARLAGRTMLVFTAGAALSLLSGCGEARVPAPSLPPSAIARQALKEYDANGDGYLDEKELERCPALKSVLHIVDTDGDKRLSEEEIANRIRLCQEARIGLMNLGCQVLLDDRPLEGATVRFLPEAFMGTSIKPASGVSEDDGTVSLQVPGAELPGLQCGYYKVEISKKGDDGRELLPPQYNSQTTLGAEVAPDLRSGGFQFHLTKRMATPTPPRPGAGDRH